MNDQQRRKVIDSLKQMKIGLDNYKDFIANLPESEEARQHLQMAKFSIIGAIHEIRAIEIEEVKVKVEEKQIKEAEVEEKEVKVDEKEVESKSSEK